MLPSSHSGTVKAGSCEAILNSDEEASIKNVIAPVMVSLCARWENSVVTNESAFLGGLERSRPPREKKMHCNDDQYSS